MGPAFKDFIKTTLTQRTFLLEEQINLLTDSTAMLEWQRAFTSKHYDPNCQWEWYELIGDVTTNKVVVWYYQARFKDLFNPLTAVGQGNLSPVATMARLKMNSISKRAYSKFARHVNFHTYIRIPEAMDTDQARSNQPPPTDPSTLKLAPPESPKSDSACEDVFEAFIGCLEYMIDHRIGQHVGYAVCYEWMKTVLDECIKDVDMSQSGLYDWKSIANERKSIAGQLMDCRIESRNISGPANPNRAPGKSQYTARYVIVVRLPGKPQVDVPQPWVVAAGKKEAEELAAKHVLENKCFERVVERYKLPLRVKSPPTHSSSLSSRC